MVVPNADGQSSTWSQDVTLVELQDLNHQLKRLHAYVVDGDSLSPNITVDQRQEECEDISDGDERREDCQGLTDADREENDYNEAVLLARIQAHSKYLAQVYHQKVTAENTEDTSVRPNSNNESTALVESTGANDEVKTENAKNAVEVQTKAANETKSGSKSLLNNDKSIIVVQSPDASHQACPSFCAFFDEFPGCFQCDV